MKFYYPFLEAMLAIVSSATGQNYPISNVANLIFLSFKGTTVTNEYSSGSNTFRTNAKSVGKCCRIAVF